jgi:hypothetical protein
MTQQDYFYSLKGGKEGVSLDGAMLICPVCGNSNSHALA